MFRMIAMTQWKWTRAVILIATVLAFSLPIASLQRAQFAYNAYYFVESVQNWGVWYALLAAGAGLLAALAAWAHDQRGRHVYALSLPVSRSRYVMMRLAAGALFLLIPVLALLFGGIVATAISNIPPGLRAYPLALAFRFLLATIVAYALFFAIGAATQKTAGILLGALAVIVLVQYGFSMAEVKFDLFHTVYEFLFSAPSVFSVFTGRWALVDV